MVSHRFKEEAIMLRDQFVERAQGFRSLIDQARQTHAEARNNVELPADIQARFNLLERDLELFTAQAVGVVMDIENIPDSPQPEEPSA